MEVALDFAVQCSPDHPWLKQHPEWFKRRPDGSMRYAENPPKKYEDIVNPDFSRDDAVALWEALRDVMLFWVDHGVRIFRVDNPHTKPLPFWEWLIHEVTGATGMLFSWRKPSREPKSDEGARRARLQPSPTSYVRLANAGIGPCLKRASARPFISFGR